MQLENVLKQMQSRYSRMLDTYYPAFGSTGFTERNLTFNFCHEALKQNDKLIVWQEAPLQDKSSHLDSVIFDDEHESLYIVEAKRLGAVNALESIVSDMKRLTEISEDWQKIRGVDDVARNKIVTVRNHYTKHLIILADLWAEHDSTEASVANSEQFILFKQKTGEKGFNQIIGPFKVDGKTLDNQKYYLFCAVKTIE